MNRRYNDHDSDSDDRETDREISLGATTILGIFFALALVCAVCFGFGYSMRGRQTPPVAATQIQQTDTPSGTRQAKPSPGSLEPAPAVTNPPEDSPAIVPTGTASADVPDSSSDSEAAAAPSVKPAPAVRPSGAAVHPAAPGSAFVQVAAVSHREDADFLLAALKKRGYTAAIRQEPQDKLLHVQLGPFASKNDAIAARNRLLTDGYNPIIK
jgi:cell division septation protein DedD